MSEGTFKARPLPSNHGFFVYVKQLIKKSGRAFFSLYFFIAAIIITEGEIED